MKVLITGISGRIGSHLARVLSQAGHDVRGLVWVSDQRRDRIEGLPVELMTGSLVSTEDVMRAVEGVEAVYHLGAAFQAGGPFQSKDYFEINVQGTFNMLEAVRKHATRIEHLFFASTDALYHKYPPAGMTHSIREDETPLRPSGWYPLSKHLGEEMCRGYHRSFGVPVTVFRFSLTVSEDEILDFSQFQLSHWLRSYEGRQTRMAAETYHRLRALHQEGKHLLIARDADGRPYKKHVADVQDIVLGLECGLGNPSAVGETFQLAGPRAFTWAEAIPYLAEKTGTTYGDVRLAEQTPTHYDFDLTKAQQLLGFQPRFDIFRMIDAALAFHRSRA